MLRTSGFTSSSDATSLGCCCDALPGRHLSFEFNASEKAPAALRPPCLTPREGEHRSHDYHATDGGGRYATNGGGR
jgi:hypothetical protein